MPNLMSKVDQDLVELLQNLIRIPSWVSETQNENQLVNFLGKWLVANTNMEVEYQELPGGRVNLIAKKGNPDLVFLAHTDTVKPSIGSPYNPFEGEIHDGSVWGLGATDMKSGIATMIQALKLCKDVDNVWLFLYADEEYNFLGMKHLIREYSHIRPKLMVSSDGSDLKFGYGCRGLIEFRVRVQGKSGHAARGNGKNAIWGSFEALDDLKSYLEGFAHPVMGGTSMNLASIVGGAELSDGSSFLANRLIKTGQAGNVVPDIAEFVVDIRPASPDLTIDSILNTLFKSLEGRELKAQVLERTHSLGAWYTNPERLGKYIQIASNVNEHQKVEFDDPGGSGYLDLQMFWQSVEKPNAFMFGGGIGDTAHSAHERIPIVNLIKTRNFFLEVLRSHLP